MRVVATARNVAALADRIGLDEAAAALRGIDDYYADINHRPEAVSTQLIRQLADPDRETASQAPTNLTWTAIAA